MNKVLNNKVNACAMEIYFTLYTQNNSWCTVWCMALSQPLSACCTLIEWNLQFVCIFMWGGGRTQPWYKMSSKNDLFSKNIYMVMGTV